LEDHQRPLCHIERDEHITDYKLHYKLNSEHIPCHQQDLPGTCPYCHRVTGVTPSKACPSCHTAMPSSISYHKPSKVTRKKTRSRHDPENCPTLDELEALPPDY
jgi:hypothetical protein